MFKLFLLLFLFQQETKNIIIGDSQVPWIDLNTKKAVREPNLWKGGVAVDWLITRLKVHPVNKKVENVILVIGTNGVFGKYKKDDIPGLFTLIKKDFPNAKILVVQGSWGWMKGKKVTEEFVRSYYKKYEELGGIIIEPPIGDIEPHQNHKIYKVIGSNLDAILN